MPIHAVLGATGATGSAILKCLLTSQIPDLHLNILVRSKSKLLQDSPQIESSSTTTIFEGSASNKNILQASLKGVSTIYVCISTNVTARKVVIATTTAAQVIAALRQLQLDMEPGTEIKPPVLLFNRSLTLNHDVKMPVPDFIMKFFAWVISAIYEDLQNAHELYTKAERDGLFTLVTVDGPMLMDPKGTEATGHRLMLSGSTTAWINYADFGKAIVEAGQRREEFGGKAVGVGATGATRVQFWYSTRIMLQGLKNRMWPL